MIDKKYLIIVPILLLISITIFVLKNKPELKFYLEDKYYEKSGFVDIDDTKLNELIDSKESFALFVYQPACVTSSNFEKVLNEFLDENPIQIYKIAFSNIKDTSLSKKIKYYPSFAIFNEGKMIDYLDADSDDDLKYYETKDGFNKWFTNYVLLKNMPNVNRIVENNKDETNDKSGLEKINLENVVYNELIARGYNVNIGNLENGGIDFIATRFEEKIYIQVTYILSDESVVKREFDTYNKIEDNYPKYVITMDKFDFSQNGIIHKNIIDWLLDK